MTVLAGNPYAIEGCFDRGALQSPEGRRKARLLATLAPDGCETILDAGGGTGWATVELRVDRRVVTLDSSVDSLRHAEGEVIAASVEALPCADRSFDMVMSSQVLEHLDNGALGRAVREMDRVARDYLLVSVPYREALDARQVRCGACGTVFHPDHHCRSFSEPDLAQLFPGWIMAEWHVFGPLQPGSGVLRAKGRTPASDIPPAFRDTVCPGCSKHVGDEPADDGRDPPSAWLRLVSFAQRVARRLGRNSGRRYSTFLPQAVAPFWMAALFVREGAPAAIDAELMGRRPRRPGGG